jgi:hypothetical protein
MSAGAGRLRRLIQRSWPIASFSGSGADERPARTRDKDAVGRQQPGVDVRPKAEKGQVGGSRRARIGRPPDGRGNVDDVIVASARRTATTS